MKFPSPVTAQWLAELTGSEVIGDASSKATGINEIHKVEEGDVVFVDHPKYYDTCLNSAAGFIIINSKPEAPAGKVLLYNETPFEAYKKIVAYFRPFDPGTKMINSHSIGEGSFIYPNVYIGKNVTIGKNCIIYPNVTIMDHCIIGDHVIIQAGTVIGSEAFYYNSKAHRQVKYEKMPSCGRVILEDFVEIGAGCTIDRGVTHDTIIKKGTKIDNLVHIGHDTVIGENSLLAGQVGIAGATTLERNVTLWGQVGVSKTLNIGENAVVLAQSGVSKSLKGNTVYFGYPAEDASEKKRELVWIKRIPEIWKKLHDK
jgi:UDP-3-O-[3-hydroxymyristoyl] glucosamine N-acyltransferase